VKFLIRWISIALAVALAIRFVPGIEMDYGIDTWWTLAVFGLMLGLVNVTLGNLLRLFSFPVMILTLGLFNIVINALMLMFTAWLTNGLFGTGLIIGGFWPAVGASIIISFVTMIMTALFTDDEKKKDRC